MTWLIDFQSFLFDLLVRLIQWLIFIPLQEFTQKTLYRKLSRMTPFTTKTTLCIWWRWVFTIKSPTIDDNTDNIVTMEMPQKYPKIFEPRHCLFNTLFINKWNRGKQTKIFDRPMCSHGKVPCFLFLVSTGILLSPFHRDRFYTSTLSH